MTPNPQQPEPLSAEDFAAVYERAGIETLRYHIKNRDAITRAQAIDETLEQVINMGERLRFSSVMPYSIADLLDSIRPLKTTGEPK